MATVREILTRAARRSGKSIADSSVSLALVDYFNQTSELVMMEDWRWLTHKGSIDLVVDQRDYLLPEDYLFLVTTVYDPTEDYHWMVRNIDQQFKLDPDEDFIGSIPDANVLLGLNEDGRWEIYFSPTPQVARTVNFWYQKRIRDIQSGELDYNLDQVIPKYLQPAWIYGTAWLFLGQDGAYNQAAENKSMYDNYISRARNMQRLQVKRMGGRMSRQGIRERQALISDRPVVDIDFSN